jgi:hypothetical protein
MNRIKICAWFVCLALAPLAHARKTVLPDACGDPKVEFQVKAVDDHSQPLTPDAGKALLVFVEENKDWGSNVTIRYGLDGVWVGATHGSQYFLVPLTLGEHHLCASMQGKLGMGSPEHYVGTESLTAEAGKVYFYGAVVAIVGSGGSAGSTVVVPAPAGSMGAPTIVNTGGGGGNRMITVSYGFLKEDDGKYRVKAGKMAVAKPEQ